MAESRKLRLEGLGRNPGSIPCRREFCKPRRSKGFKAYLLAGLLALTLWIFGPLCCWRRSRIRRARAVQSRLLPEPSHEPWAL